MKKIQSVILLILALLICLPPYAAMADTPERTLINVKDFGAAGNGVTDDRDAILAAFEYARDKMPATVYFPEGDYGLSFDALYVHLPHGSGDLIVKGDGGDKSRIVYLENWTTRGEWVALRIMPDLPEGATSSTDFSLLKPEDYLHDIIIEDLGVYDTDPKNHCWHVDKGDPFTEETHGFCIKYTHNAIMRNCLIDNVGDEALDMTYCIDSYIIDNTVVGSPGAGGAGGAVSAGDGCDNVVISGNTVIGTVDGKTNFGIAIEALIDPVKNVYVKNNIVEDIKGHAVNIGAPGSYLENIVFENNIIKNSTNGISIASLGEKTGIVLRENKISDTEQGILVSGNVTELLVDSCFIENSSECGIRVGGEDAVIKNTTIKDSAKKAIYFVGNNSLVENCIIDGSGLVDNSGPAVEQFYRSSSKINGLTITNCKNLTAILGVNEIENADVTQLETAEHLAVKRTNSIKNSKFNRSIYISVENSVVDGVEIAMKQPVSSIAAIYVISTKNVTVQNCKITTPSGYAIQEAGSVSEFNVVKNNIAYGGFGFRQVSATSTFENNEHYCIQHSFGNYVYNNDATVEKDGTKTRTCSVCGETETVTAEGTKLPEPLKWTFDAKTGTLTVSGEGKMNDFTSKNTPWQEHSSNIKKVIVEDGVTSIGNWAFAYLYNLESVQLPQSIEKIGSNAFYVCSALKEIVLPEKVTTIEVGTFYLCKNLEIVYLPKTVQRINVYAFYGCDKLHTVTYGGKVTDFNNIIIADNNDSLLNANKNCTDSVINWTFDKETATLLIKGSGEMKDFEAKTAPWFLYSNEIKNVVVEDGVTSIGKWAFAYFYNLESVQLPQSIEKIGSNAFYVCYALKKIALPEKITTIEVGTFYFCKKLEILHLPKSVTRVNVYAFDGCNRLHTVNYDGKLDDFNYIYIAEYNDPLLNASRNCDGDFIDWTFDSESSTLTVSGSGEMGNFAAKKSPWYDISNDIKKVVVEDGITTIGNWAFAYLYNLESVTLPDTILQIGTNAFYVCNSLSEIEIPQKISKIGVGTFYNCVNLEKITLPRKLAEIGKHAFNGCKKLSLVVFGGSTEAWNNLSVAEYNEPLSKADIKCDGDVVGWEFDEKTGTLTITGSGVMDNYGAKTSPWYSISNDIKKVVVEEGVVSIGNWAFAYCYSLSDVSLPQSLTKIGSNAFYVCNSLENIEIKGTATEIGVGTFYFCKNLESISIPASVAKIGKFAFDGCNALETVNFGGNETLAEMKLCGKL